MRKHKNSGENIMNGSIRSRLFDERQIQIQIQI